MITKFLYHITKEKRKVLSGLVENDDICEYESDKRFPLALENSPLSPGEKKIISKGRVGYIVFRDDEDMYLDVNIFDGEVKIALTNNISHAACYSEEFFAAILDYAGYFGYDSDPEFVDSGLKLVDDMYQDSYTIFKNIKDASYCKLTVDGKSLFLARDEAQKYYLTNKFEDASKVAKQELRRVLLINKFVSKDTDKSDISFSSYKYLSNALGEFIYAGRNPYKLSFIEGSLELELDPIIPTDFRLRDSEETFLLLKDISYLISKEKSDKSFYLESSNNMYLKKDSTLKYSFVSNPYDASFLNDYDIELVKAAFKVLLPDMSFRRKNKNVYLYYEGNKYSLCNNPLPNYTNGRMIDKKEYEAFMSAFDISFNTAKREKGIILICNNKYLNIEINSKTSFNVLLTDSSYNASLFTQEEAKAIKDVLGFDFSERSLDSVLLSDLRIYKIDSKKPNISANYRAIMQDMLSKRTALSDYTDTKSLRLETEKASLEYLRRFYLKSVYDYKELFSKVVDDNTKKVLIISPLLNLELQGLDLVGKKLDVYTLNEMKFGYLPNVSLENISYKGSYRLKLSNLPKSFIDQFDIVLFGAGFNEDSASYKPTMDSIINSDKETIFLQSRIVCAHDDMVFSYFNTYTKISRKYYSYEFPYEELASELDNRYVDYLIKAGGRIHNKVSISREDSYHSIIKVGNGKVESLI